eukprot:1599183-Alexandrium_andersonii.AAC.1
MHGLAVCPTPLLGPYPFGYWPPEGTAAQPCIPVKLYGPPEPGHRLQLRQPGASWGLGGPPPLRDP